MGCFFWAVGIGFLLVVVVGELMGFDMVQFPTPLNAEERWRQHG